MCVCVCVCVDMWSFDFIRDLFPTRVQPELHSVNQSKPPRLQEGGDVERPEAGAAAQRVSPASVDPTELQPSAVGGWDVLPSKLTAQTSEVEALGEMNCESSHCYDHQDVYIHKNHVNVEVKLLVFFTKTKPQNVLLQRHDLVQLNFLVFI